MQYRPYPIPWEEAVRFVGRPTEVLNTPGGEVQLIMLPRTLDVEDAVGPDTADKPGDGYKPYGNALDFGVQVQSPGGIFGAVDVNITVWQIVTGVTTQLFVYRLSFPTPLTPVFQSVVSFSGFVADAWEITAESRADPCTLTIFGFAGWVPGMRIARGPTVVAPFYEPAIA